MPDDTDVEGPLVLASTQAPATLSPDAAKLIEAARRLVVQAICQRINAKLGAQTVFSEPLKELLYRAWTVAAQLRNMEVGIDHVIVVYATSDAALNDRFKGPLGDRIVPLAGAMIRLAGQRAVLGPPEIASLLPHDALAGWLREAGRRASARGASSVDLTTDFLGVLSDPNADPNTQKAIRDTLDRTSDAERMLTQVDRARRDIVSISRTAGHHRTDILTAMNNLSGTVTQSLSNTIAEVKSVTNDLAKSQNEAITQANMAAEQQRADAAAGMTTFTEAVRKSLAETSREFKGLTEVAVNKHESAIASTTGAVALATTSMQTCRDGIVQEVQRLFGDINKTDSAYPTPPLSTLWVIGAVSGALALGFALGAAIFAFGPRLIELMK
jgi:uncharacterized protein YbjQ (UPF0145 family)